MNWPAVIWLLSGACQFILLGRWVTRKRISFEGELFLAVVGIYVFLNIAWALRLFPPDSWFDNVLDQELRDWPMLGK